MPSLKNTALIFPEIFLIECCAVLAKPPMTSSHYSQTRKYLFKAKKDILKRKTLFFYTLKGLSNNISSNYFLLHRHLNHRWSLTRGGRCREVLFRLLSVLNKKEAWAAHYTVIRHDSHLRTEEKLMHSSSVLKCPECNTQLRLLYLLHLLYDIDFTAQNRQ